MYFERVTYSVQHSAEEIGQTILYLASPAGAYANGSTIKVDGQWSKWC